MKLTVKLTPEEIKHILELLSYSDNSKERTILKFKQLAEKAGLNK